jgi:ATP-binding cassette subfamily C protein
MPRHEASSPEANLALRSNRSALIGVGVFSALLNVLALTGSLFMLQVYDRVIPSHSVPTLVGLSVLAGVLYAGQCLLDFARARVLLRIGRSIDERLSQRIFMITARLPLMRKMRCEGLQPLRDLDQVRSFLAGSGPVALFDLPWMPIYLAICFLFHPLIGVAVLFGALILAAVTALTEAFTRKPMREAAVHAAARMSIAEASRRNSEVLAAMGMTRRLANLWQEVNQKHLDAHEKAGDVAGGLGGFSKTFRMALQSGVLAIGAYLVIRGDATGGIMFAGAMLSARALAPVELVISNWKSFVAARQGWSRLRELMATVPVESHCLPLRPPVTTLSVEGIMVAPPSEQKMVVKGVSFHLRSGSALGIIGPSASGKSSLVRALVGIWSPLRGSIRLDGAALDQWSPEALGRHIGYLPQDIGLFDGTVAQNIARFEADADPEAIIAAAETAGVHEMIVLLPEGYDTRIGEGGMALSAGQRQRIGLARALYGNPFLVVLDEPNSNLDIEGEQALSKAIASVRDRSGIVVVVAHRPSALSSVDFALVMNNGEAQAFGPKDEVLRKSVRPINPAHPQTAVGAA